LQADTDALALFALEVSDALAARSLECAYASALSVVAQSRDVEQEADLDAMNEAGGPEGFSGKVNRKSLSEESSARLRSQLMSMYFKVCLVPLKASNRSSVSVFIVFICMHSQPIPSYIEGVRFPLTSTGASEFAIAAIENLKWDIPSCFVTPPGRSEGVDCEGGRHPLPFGFSAEAVYRRFRDGSDEIIDG